MIGGFTRRFGRYSPMDSHPLIPLISIFRLRRHSGHELVVNPEISMSHTLLALRQIKFHHDNFIESEKWMKGYALKKWESTLNLCVHAHGYDVELIMKPSCRDKYSLGINHLASMIGSLAIMVLAMMFSFDSISRTRSITCLLLPLFLFNWCDGEKKMN